MKGHLLLLLVHFAVQSLVDLAIVTVPQKYLDGSRFSLLILTFALTLGTKEVGKIYFNFLLSLALISREFPTALVAASAIVLYLYALWPAVVVAAATEPKPKAE